MADIVLSVFDDQYGPKPVYSTVDMDTARTVAFKSQLTLSMSPEGVANGVDAVIPLQTVSKMAYVYLFMVRDKTTDREHVAALSFIIDEDHRFGLYKNIQSLRKQAEDLSRNVQTVYENIEKATSHKLENQLKTWGSDLESPAIVIEEEYKKQRIIVQSKTVAPSISFLFDVTKKSKNLATVITALLQQRPLIIVSSNPTFTDIVISSLELFTPHRTLKKIMAQKDPVTPSSADIIVINPEIAKMYSSEIVLNIDKKSVTKDKHSQFVTNLLSEIRNKDLEEARRVINDYIAILLDKVSLLTEIFFDENGNDSGEMIKHRKKIIESVSTSLPEAFDIILEITTSINPLIATTLRKEVQEWKEGTLKFMKEGW